MLGTLRMKEEMGNRAKRGLSEMHDQGKACLLVSTHFALGDGERLVGEGDEYVDQTLIFSSRNLIVMTSPGAFDLGNDDLTTRDLVVEGQVFSVDVEIRFAVVKFDVDLEGPGASHLEGSELDVGSRIVEVKGGIEGESLLGQDNHTAIVVQILELEV
jgi:hypothetical protein